RRAARIGPGRSRRRRRAHAQGDQQPDDPGGRDRRPWLPPGRIERAGREKCHTGKIPPWRGLGGGDVPRPRRYTAVTKAAWDCVVATLPGTSSGPHLGRRPNTDSLSTFEVRADQT